MDFLKEWTYTVCVTLVASVVFSLLLPKGNTGKFAKIIITVFIIFSFVAPFASGGISAELKDFGEFDFSRQNDEIKNNSYAQIIKQNILAALDDGGYENCAVSVEVSANGDNSDGENNSYGEIEIVSVKVAAQDIYDTEEVKNYLLEKLGISAEVYNIGQ